MIIICLSLRNKVYIDNITISIQSSSTQLNQRRKLLAIIVPLVDIIMSQNPQDMNSIEPQQTPVSFDAAELPEPRQPTHAQLLREDSLNSPLQTISIPSQLLPEHPQQHTSPQNSELNPIVEGTSPQPQQHQQDIIPATSTLSLQNQEGGQIEMQHEGQGFSRSQRQADSNQQYIISEKTEEEKVPQGKESEDAISQLQPPKDPEVMLETLPEDHRDQAMTEASLVEYCYQQIPVEELEEDQVFTSGMRKRQIPEEHYFYGVEYQQGNEKELTTKNNHLPTPEQQLPIPTNQIDELATTQRKSTEAEKIQTSDLRPIPKENTNYQQQRQESTQQSELHAREVSILNIHAQNCTVVVQPQPGSQPRQPITASPEATNKTDQVQIASKEKQPQSGIKVSIQPHKPEEAVLAAQIEVKPQQQNQKEVMVIGKEQSSSITESKPRQRQILRESRPNFQGASENRAVTTPITIQDKHQLPRNFPQEQPASIARNREIERAVPISHPLLQDNFEEEITTVEQHPVKVSNQIDAYPLETAHTHNPPEGKSGPKLNKATAEPPLTLEEQKERKDVPDKAPGKKKKKAKKSKPVQEEQRDPKPTILLANQNQNKNEELPSGDSKDKKERQQGTVPIKIQPRTQDQLNPSMVNNSAEIKSEELPPLTSQIIENEAYKERMGSTYNVFLKYVSNYTKAIAFYKSIVENVSFQINRRKNQRNNLLAMLGEYFEGYAKLNQEFHLKTHSLQYVEAPSSNNPYGNIKFELKKGYNALIELRKSVANEKNRISSFVLGTIMKDIQKTFSVYFGKISAEETKQAQRRAEHLTRQKVFLKVISQVEKVFKKGINGKFKVDIFSQLARFVNDEVTHRQFLKIYGKGIVPLRHAYIQAECELFNTLQQILNTFKTESKVLYSVGRRLYDHIEDLSRTVKDQTKFQQISPLTDIDYIRYVLELQEKKDHRVFKTQHFQSYLDLIFFDKLVGNIRDVYKGAICKVFPMNLPHQELIHTVSGNLVHFNRDTDQCLNVFVIKNINARIIGQCTVQFDQLLKGFIFDENRTVRIKLKDNDRAQELICYLNEKDEDFVVEGGPSAEN